MPYISIDLGDYVTHKNISRLKTRLKAAEPEDGASFHMEAADSSAAGHVHDGVSSRMAQQEPVQNEENRPGHLAGQEKNP